MKRPTDLIIRRVLNETASAQEAEEVAAWLATDEGRTWLDQDMEHMAEGFVSGTISVLEHIPTEELLRRIDRIIDRTKRRRWLFRAAAVLIPCALIVGVWFNLNSRLGGILFAPATLEQTVAARGERKEIIFQDGTKVFLNAGTQITYPRQFGLAERRIRLNGEAYFEVTPNTRRPFVVEIGEAVVKVLGTSFNIKAHETDPTVDVVLIEGRVEFLYGGRNYTMAPSQKLVFDKADGAVHLSAEEHADHATLWRKEIISLRDASLREVIATLEHWYNVQFEVTDAAAYQRTFSLQTPKMPLPELLAEMETISDVRFSINGQTVSVCLKR